MDYDVQDGEEFPHGGDEYDHLGFSVLNESLVERFDCGVMLQGNDGGHVQGVSDLNSSSPGDSFSSESAAVAVGGSDSDQACDLLSIESPQFR